MTATVVIGAGPAGLTAALQLASRGHPPVVLEADDVVGGISRTVERNGWRFDIGGHRFFTKVSEVEALWRALLPGDDFMTRPRMSRIYYGGRFYDYPLKPANALRNLGLRESMLCGASYAAARLRRARDVSTFEGWVSSRFGQRLYRTFFKTYTEKVWGVPASSLPADWAAQRIKNLSLGKAVLNGLSPRRQTNVTSLIEEFLYPRLGPGMMWEACRDAAVEHGTQLHLNSPVVSVARDDQGVRAVRTGRGAEFPCDAVVSSMPIGHLVHAMSPAAPGDVLDAAKALRHRDFMTVALVVPESAGFPDNWIYVHSPGVRLGRVQNFGSWSPHMVKPGWTCLGLEYFVNQGDDLWSMDDADLVDFAAAEMHAIGLLEPGVVREGFVTRTPMAYPVYDAAYADNLAAVRAWLETAVPNAHPVGRNGMHRYNNQDHSMLTAMLAVENILDGAGHDLWKVNVDAEYHEEGSTATTATSNSATSSGTGRDAPITG